MKILQKLTQITHYCNLKKCVNATWLMGVCRQWAAWVWMCWQLNNNNFFVISYHCQTFVYLSYYGNKGFYVTLFKLKSWSSSSPNSARKQHWVLGHNGYTRPQFVQGHMAYICTTNQDITMFHIYQSEQSVHQELFSRTWKPQHTCKQIEIPFIAYKQPPIYNKNCSQLGTE